MSSAELEAEKKERHNINVRAAFIHAIGDLIYSIGVIIAGYIIKFIVSERKTEKETEGRLLVWSVCHRFLIFFGLV